MIRVKIPGALLAAFTFFMGLAGPAHAVDGVIEINQARALAGGVTPGDVPGFPVTISESGSYRLTSNLMHQGDVGCTFSSIPLVADSTSLPCVVDIVSDNVTLDLNGFTIDTGAFANGVNATGQSSIEACSGVVQNAAAIGIGVGLTAASREFAP